MSFILDAMTRRQVLRGPKTGALFHGSDPPRQRRLSAWPLGALALVLACIVAMGVAYVYRPQKPEAVPPNAPGAPPPVVPKERLVTEGAGKQVLPKEPGVVVRFPPPTSLAQPLPPPGPVAPGAQAIAPPLPVVPGKPDDVSPPSGLPAHVTAELRRLTVRAHVHAPHRQHRFIIVADRQLREGDELLAGVRIDEITRTGLVLRHKNTRFASPVLTGQNFIGATSTEP